MTLNLGMHQLLFAQHPQPMWLLDTPTGTFLDVNQAALKLYGYTRAEFLALDVTALSAPDLSSCLLTPPSSNYDALVFHRHRSGALLSLQLKAASVMLDQAAALLVTLQDMTQYQQTCQALEHSEMRWNRLLESMGEGLWEWNMRTGELLLSPRWKALLGYAPDALMDGAASWEQLVHPDDLPACQSAIEAHLAGFEGFFEIDHRLRSQSGLYRWFRSRAKIVDWTADGQPAYMLGTLRDITHQKELEVSLKATEQRLQLAQQAAGIGIWDVDLPSRKVVWDRPTRAIFGVSLEADFEPSFQAWRERVHPDDLPRLLSRSFAELGQDPFHYTHRIVRPTGEVRFMETHGQVLWNSQGEPIRMLGMSLDITARKEAEAIQIENQERLELARSTGLMGIWDMDLASGTAIWDARTREIFGVNADFQPAYESWKAMVHPDDLPLLFQQPIADYGHEPFHIEHRIVRPSGEIRHIENHGVVLWNPAGEAYRMLGLNIDITARKLAEADLQHSKQALEESHTQLEALVTQLHDMASAAQSANHAKNAFITNMSHEIRTPLNGIIGMTDLLLASATSTEQRHFMEVIRNSGEVLLDLVNDILDFAKMEARQLELTREAFDLPTLMAQTTQILSLSACEKGLELLSRLESDLPSQLVGDPARLRQVLLNLGSNAIKFTEQGQVEIQIRRVAETAERVRLRFEIVDSGVGIAPEQMQSIFEPFVQGDNSLTRPYGGAGLGLSISKNITAAMGGQLKMRSQVGMGSCFYFEIDLEKQSPVRQMEARPLALTAPFPTQTKRTPLPAKRAMRILLAEDNPINQALAQAMISRMGHQLEIAENGQEALQALQHQRYDLVLMDCQMPVMDGYAATRQIRQGGTGVLEPQVPIIALTAHAMDSARQDCLEAGMDDYLSKPFHFDQLEAMLTRWKGPAEQLRQVS